MLNTNKNNKEMLNPRIIVLIAALAVFTLMAFTGGKLHIDTYRIDTKLSSLEWYAEKTTGKHHGIILFSSGEITNDHGKFTGTFDQVPPIFSAIRINGRRAYKIARSGKTAEIKAKTIKI